MDEEDDVHPGTDAALHAEGFVVITPMRADEDDSVLLAEFQGWLERLPALRPKDNPN